MQEQNWFIAHRLVTVSQRAPGIVMYSWHPAPQSLFKVNRERQTYLYRPEGRQTALAANRTRNCSAAQSAMATTGEQHCPKRSLQFPSCPWLQQLLLDVCSPWLFWEGASTYFPLQHLFSSSRPQLCWWGSHQTQHTPVPLATTPPEKSSFTRNEERKNNP